MADDNELASLRRDFREIAREEAKAVYDDLGAVDAEGKEWTLRGLMNSFNIDRRTALQAIGLIALGYAAPTAVVHSISGTARAAPTGQEGTAANPIDIIYADEIGQSGDEVTTIFTDSVDAGTVTADEVARGSDWSDGTTIDFINAVNSSDQGLSASIQQTASVSTSAKEIVAPPTIRNANMVLVRGKDGSGNRFADLVWYIEGGSPTAQFSDTLASPTARTYSRVGTSRLALAMASGTYSVTAVSIQARETQ